MFKSQKSWAYIQYKPISLNLKYGGINMTINPNSQVITLSTLTSDKAVESSVLNGMFVKGYYQRKDDTNHTLVPESTIMNSIKSQIAKAKAKGFLNQPVKVYTLATA
jgi:hypothetical protein